MTRVYPRSDAPLVSGGKWISPAWQRWISDLWSSLGFNASRPRYEAIGFTPYDGSVSTAVLDNGISHCAFATGADTQIDGVVQIPHNYVPGTPLTPYMLVAAASASGIAKLNFHYALAGDGEVAATGSPSLSPTIPVTAKQRTLVVFSEISGSGIEPGDAISIGAEREGTDAADTNAGNIFVLRAGVFVKTMGVGNQAAQP